MPTDSMFGSAYLNPQMQGQTTFGFAPQQKKSMFQLSPTGDYAPTDYTGYMPEQTAPNSVLFGGTPSYELPAQDNSWLNNIGSMLTKPDGSMDWSGAGAIAYGVGSIFNAYNQGQYQDRMANLYKQQYDMQKTQQERANQRQDLAQANYNKAMGV